MLVSCTALADVNLYDIERVIYHVTVQDISPCKGHIFVGMFVP